MTEDRLDDLENRVRYLELRVNQPPPEDVKDWISIYYDSAAQAAEAIGVTRNFIHKVTCGASPASEKIIKRMISDGFYGPDAMGRVDD